MKILTDVKAKGLLLLLFRTFSCFSDEIQNAVHLLASKIQTTSCIYVQQIKYFIVEKGCFEKSRLKRMSSCVDLSNSHNM